jgi:hypothetical protein
MAVKQAMVLEIFVCNPVIPAVVAPVKCSAKITSARLLVLA